MRGGTTDFAISLKQEQVHTEHWGRRWRALNAAYLSNKTLRNGCFDLLEESGKLKTPFDVGDSSIGNISITQETSG